MQKGRKEGAGGARVGREPVDCAWVRKPSPKVVYDLLTVSMRSRLAPLYCVCSKGIEKESSAEYSKRMSSERLAQSVSDAPWREG